MRNQLTHIYGQHFHSIEGLDDINPRMLHCWIDGLKLLTGLNLFENIFMWAPMAHFMFCQFDMKHCIINQ